MHLVPLPDAPGYLEQFRTPDLSVGYYRIPVGVADPQSPHTEDEVYVVLSGRARFTGDDTGTIEVGAGDVLFVPAGEGHRFSDVTEELVTVVLFGPAEGSRG